MENAKLDSEIKKMEDSWRIYNRDEQRITNRVSTARWIFSFLLGNLIFNDHRTYFFTPYLCSLVAKPLIFQTFTIWPYKIPSLKYQRSTTSSYNDSEIIKSGFVITAHLFNLHFVEFSSLYLIQGVPENMRHADFFTMYMCTN